MNDNKQYRYIYWKVTLCNIIIKKEKYELCLLTFSIHNQFIVSEDLIFPIQCNGGTFSILVIHGNFSRKLHNASSFPPEAIDITKDHFNSIYGHASYLILVILRLECMPVFARSTFHAKFHWTTLKVGRTFNEFPCTIIFAGSFVTGNIVPSSIT